MFGGIDFGGDRFAFVIFRGDDVFTFVAHAVSRFVGSQLNIEKIFDRRHDNFLLIAMRLAVADHHSLNPEVRDMFFGDVEFDQLNRASHVDDFAA